MTNEAAERLIEWWHDEGLCDPYADIEAVWEHLDEALAAERRAGAADERERADLLEAGLMVNMNIRQSETLTWARRLIEADARVIKPWLTSPEAFLDAEAQR